MFFILKPVLFLAHTRCFQRTWNFVPLSFDMFDFGRSFRMQGYNTIRIYITYDVLLINEADHVFKRNRLLEVIIKF